MMRVLVRGMVGTVTIMRHGSSNQSLGGGTKEGMVRCKTMVSYFINNQSQTSICHLLPSQLAADNDSLIGSPLEMPPSITS